MELINVPQRLTRGQHNIVVSHSSTALTRGLELGETVVVRDADGRRRTADVTGFEFTEDDTLYTMVLGAPVSGAGDDARPAERTSVDDVVDMLEELRRQRRAPESDSADPLARILTNV